MPDSLPTAQIRYDALSRIADGQVMGEQDSFVCPHPACGAFTVHRWGNVLHAAVHAFGKGQATRSVSNQPRLVLAMCTLCGRETVFVNHALLYPRKSEAPPPSPDIPPEIRPEYDEAAAIYTASPRGAAALLRLAIQKLCPVLGSTKPDINAAIGELVAEGKISPAIQKALDSVRVIGNEAVHPGTLDLKDKTDTALSLFRLINFVVEKAITEPRELEAIYAGLPENKLAGIEQRDTPRT